MLRMCHTLYVGVFLAFPGSIFIMCTNFLQDILLSQMPLSWGFFWIPFLKDRLSCVPTITVSTLMSQMPLIMYRCIVAGTLMANFTSKEWCCAEGYTVVYILLSLTYVLLVIDTTVIPLCLHYPFPRSSCSCTSLWRRKSTAAACTTLSQGPVCWRTCPGSLSRSTSQRRSSTAGKRLVLSVNLCWTQTTLPSLHLSLCMGEQVCDSCNTLMPT